CARSGVWDYW
nr:immunoglobulin heavy chain junction region [Mus musculus]